MFLLYFYFRKTMLMKEEPRPVILLPYDFTEVSKYGVKHAVALARMLGYSITVLNVLDASTKMYLKLSNMQKQDLQYKLNDLCNFVMQNNKDVRVDYFFKKGSVKTISEIAEELNVRNCFNQGVGQRPF